MIREQFIVYVCVCVCFLKNWLSMDISSTSKIIEISIQHNEIYIHWLCSSSKREKLVMWCVLLLGRLCGLPGSGERCIPAIVICRLGPIVQKLIKIWKAGESWLQPPHVFEYRQISHHNRQKMYLCWTLRQKLKPALPVFQDIATSTFVILLTFQNTD